MFIVYSWGIIIPSIAIFAAVKILNHFELLEEVEYRFRLQEAILADTVSNIVKVLCVTFLALGLFAGIKGPIDLGPITLANSPLLQNVFGNVAGAVIGGGSSSKQPSVAMPTKQDPMIYAQQKVLINARINKTGGRNYYTGSVCNHGVYPITVQYRLVARNGRHKHVGWHKLEPGAPREFRKFLPGGFVKQWTGETRLVAAKY